MRLIRSVISGLKPLALIALLAPCFAPTAAVAGGSLSVVNPVFRPTGSPVAWPTDISSAASLFASTGANACAVIIGDSTSTLSANSVYSSELLARMLEGRLRRAFPGKTFKWYNRAISGTTWHDFASTSTTDPNPTGHPGWTWAAGQTWSAQVASLGCQLVFTNFGINDTYGLSPADISTSVGYMAGYTPVPGVVMITAALPSRDPSNSGNGQYTPAWQNGVRTANGYTRTLVNSNAAAANISSTIALGLIDVGRYFVQARDGYDPGNGYLVQTLASPITGIAISTSSAYTLPISTKLSNWNGDFHLGVTFPGAGTTPLTGGGTTLNLDATPSGKINIDNGNGGNPRVRFLMQGGGSTVTDLNGSCASSAIPAGDLTLDFALKGERVTVALNGTICFNGLVTRFAGPFQPTLLSNGGTMTVNQFDQGVPVSVDPIFTSAQLFGVYGGVNLYGGNGNNHMSGIGTNAIVGSVLAATRFSSSGQ